MQCGEGLANWEAANVEASAKSFSGSQPRASLFFRPGDLFSVMFALYRGNGRFFGRAPSALRSLLHFIT